MANTFKVVTKAGVTSADVIYTAGSGVTAIVLGLILGNTTTSQITSIVSLASNTGSRAGNNNEDNQKVDLGSSTDVATTPKTNQPLTGVFYSDAEKVLQRPDTPVIFPNKQALIDFFAKNRYTITYEEIPTEL